MTAVDPAAPLLSLAAPSSRDQLADFVARVVRLDPVAVVRLRAANSGLGGESRVEAWAGTPFEVLVGHAVPGSPRPADLTVHGRELLAALAVARGETVEPGARADGQWRAELPPAQGWAEVAEVPLTRLAELAERGLVAARDRAGPHGTPPDELLDESVFSAPADRARPGGRVVRVPLRCLFALSGLGLLDGRPDEVARLSATEAGGAWLRLSTDRGAVSQPRRALLPLVF
jgi:hypothetical protein